MAGHATATNRPNRTNTHDACCRCGHLHPTPTDHQAPKDGDLVVWQPNATDPPQWICTPCVDELEAPDREADAVREKARG